jgi:hypothetical protein
MTARNLSSQERQALRRWLFKSHGVRLPRASNAVLFEMEYSLFAIELVSLPKLRIWKDRDHEDLLLSFEIVPGITTLSRLFGFFGDPRDAGERQLKRKEIELRAAAELGQIWWGTESLEDRPELTSILQYFPEPQKRF